MFNIKKIDLCAIAFAATLMAGCGAHEIAPVEAAEKKDASGFLGNLLQPKQEVTVPTGTAISIRLQEPISSATAVPGDSFDYMLVEPLSIQGKLVARAGARGVGRVVAARSSGRLHNAGYLRIALASLEIDGRQVPVQSSSIVLSGGSYKKRNWAFIGGGAGAGAIIGALAGGPKGAMIGSAVGAGAGTSAAYATGKKNVGFAAERNLIFKLSHALTVKI
ncbi:MAG TPA: hypothetical protein VM056_00725 [Terriglobales bacterium]|nr:hypothetical protein [Terriglobales bacterium]